MKGTNLLTLVITLTIGIIFAGSLLMPVINDATTTEKTFTNEGYYYMQNLSAESDEEIVVEYTKTPFGITYNGEPIDVSMLDGTKRYTLATAGTDWVIRFTSAGWVGLQGIGTSFNFGNSNNEKVTITFSEGTVTAVTEAGTTSTYTTTYDSLWVYSPTPTDWVMKKMDAPAYMLKDSQFFNNGVTEISQWNEVVKIGGTVESWDAEVVYPAGITTTLSDETTDATSMDKYVDLYSLNKITFKINDGTSTADAVYSYFIVPASVTAELSQHLDKGEIAIMNAIPFLIIAALVVMAAGAIYLRRED